MSIVLGLALGFAQSASATQPQPERSLPSVRQYEACFNGWSDATDILAMTDAELISLFEEKCFEERLPAFLAMNGQGATPKQSEETLQRLSILEAEWVASNRSRVEQLAKKLGKR